MGEKQGGLGLAIARDLIELQGGTIAAVMQRCGATVECTTSAIDALLRIERRAPDVIIADIVLPDIDGCAFIERLRKNGHPSSGRTRSHGLRPSERAEANPRRGFEMLRQKPIERADLANIVARLANRPSTAAI